jgi:hypothetical protein
MKLTAVEWLFLQSTDKKLDIFDLLEAKAMEKKRVAFFKKNFADEGGNDA